MQSMKGSDITLDKASGITHISTVPFPEYTITSELTEQLNSYVDYKKLLKLIAKLKESVP